MSEPSIIGGLLMLAVTCSFTLGWIFRGHAVRTKLMSRRTVCQKTV